MTRTTSNPKYLEISAALEEQVRSGRWDGGKMPSVRGIAQLHGVSVVTASRAIQVLRDKGLIQTIRPAVPRPDPLAERWALCISPDPGPWQKATLSMAAGWFDSLGRREPMHPIRPVPHFSRDGRAATSFPWCRAKESGVRGYSLRRGTANLRCDSMNASSNVAEWKTPVVLIERNCANRPLERDLVAVDDVEGRDLHATPDRPGRSASPSSSPADEQPQRPRRRLFYAIHASQSANRKSPGRADRPLSERRFAEPEAYAKLADQVRKLELDGVVCYQDYTAMGLIVELLTRGQSVPADVAVVGFDDLPIGNTFTVGVTTYSFPSEGIAEQAVRLMRERLREPNRGPTKVVVAGRLIVRESSAGK